MEFSLYPERAPYETGYFDAGDGHSLYYERYGTSGGEPVVYLHGGPGGGCAYDEYRYFDPAHYDVLIYDQRGAPKSMPFAGINNNNIKALVADLEKMRAHFGYKNWNVTGGSFGSTLGMFYAVMHPESVKRLILRGIALGDEKDACDLIDATGPMERSRNKWFEEYRDHIPAAERADGLALPYYERLMSHDEAVAIEAARLFMRWDTSILTKDPPLDLIAECDADPRATLPISRLFFYFTVNEYMRNDYKAYLLNGMAKLKMPIDIIHGRQDWICPVENALELHEHCPQAQLHVIENCGHGIVEPALRQAFMEITEHWKSVV